MSEDQTPPIKVGYKASAEQFAPTELLNYAVAAESHGFEIVAVSDHFQPWRHHGGHAPNSLVWLGALGQATERVTMTTSVLTPTLRYAPAVVAQAFGTLGAMFPGRVNLGVGSGEAMNETPATANQWPKFKERSARLAESIALIRQLWSEDRVSFEGEYYQTANATIYDRSPVEIPIYIAAGGPKAAALVGRIGDGLIVTSGKGAELYHTLTGAAADGAREAGRDPGALARQIEIKLSYDHDLDDAFRACEPWAALALTAEEKGGTEDALEMERLAEGAKDRAHTRFIVTNDPDQVIEQLSFYVELGFRELIFHFPGEDQTRAIEQFSTDVLPRVRARWS